jgi:Putative zinc- or iron-chelating domain
MTVLEAERLRKATHVAPRLTGGRCIYLKDERCTAYQQRPLICRAWGAVPNLSCPHGCTPDRWLTPNEFLDIAQAVEQLGGALVQTVATGVEPVHDSFMRLSQQCSDDEVARRSAMVLGLRALHGGRILAVTGNPSAPGDANWINRDEEKS